MAMLAIYDYTINSWTVEYRRTKPCKLCQLVSTYCLEPSYMHAHRSFVALTPQASRALGSITSYPKGPAPGTCHTWCRVKAGTQSMIYEMHADRTSQCTEYMTLAYTGHNADAGATTEPKQIASADPLDPDNT